MTEEYFFRVLSSDIFVSYFTPDNTGVSVPHISPTQIAEFVIPVPPVQEQEAISQLIETETAKTDSLIREANAVVSLLQERRTALISAAVTGKIDVRQAVAP